MSAAEQAPATLPQMTYDEFLDWADEDTLAEWVDGVIVMTSPASARHQLIKIFLVHALERFVDHFALGMILDAPFQMKLARSGREPDVLFIAAAHADRLTPTYLDGPADLAIEILSPESAERDRVQKFFEYQAAGVAEYWLIDPLARIAEFYQLETSGEQRVYRRVGTDEQGDYHAREIPGFWLRVAWLWEEPLPSVDDVLFAVIGQPYLDRLTERARQHGLIPRGDESR